MLEQWDKPVVVDFETYYDNEYSLKKITTEEYIRSDKFECIGVSVKIGQQPAEFYPREEGIPIVRALAEELGSVFVSHNCLFDMGILGMRYNIHPDMTVDTVTLARLTGVDRLAGGSSLAKLADWLPTVGVDIPPKGTAVHNMIGVHADDMTAEQWREYADYCKHDSEISARLYYLLMPRMLGTEIEMANITTKMWTHPVIDLDRPLLEQYYANLEVERDRLMDDMARRLALPSAEELGKVLRSRSKFPKLLETLGVEVPMKWSEKQQKNTPALAKTDPGFLELLEHEDPFIAELCQLRLDAASTLAMTRTKRFIEVSKRGLLPVPLIYASAHTGRYGGGGKLNIQNLPKRGNDLTIRRSMRAPKGCLWVAADSSQIEARLVAYAAGQQDLVDVFTSGRDVYVDMATKIYGESYDDIMAQAKGRDATPEGKKKRNIAKEVVLACGYGMSPATFARRMELQGMHEVAEQAEFLVGTYRNAYPMIKAFWNTCNTALETMLVGGEVQFGSNDLFRAVGRYDVFGTNIPCVVLPDGTRIFYENLRKIGKGRRTETAYDQMKGRAKMETRIYGAKLTENLIQGLAFSVLKDQARRMANRGLHLVLNIHDEWATIVPERLAGAAAAIMYEEMTSVPLYLPQNLLACEVDVGRNYADMSFVNVGKILARAGV